MEVVHPPLLLMDGMILVVTTAVDTHFCVPVASDPFRPSVAPRQTWSAGEMPAASSFVAAIRCD